MKHGGRQRTIFGEYWNGLDWPAAAHASVLPDVCAGCLCGHSENDHSAYRLDCCQRGDHRGDAHLVGCAQDLGADCDHAVRTVSGKDHVYGAASPAHVLLDICPALTLSVPDLLL